MFLRLSILEIHSYALRTKFNLQSENRDLKNDFLEKRIFVEFLGGSQMVYI